MAFPSLALAIDTTSKPLEIPNDWTLIPGPRSFRLHQGRQQLLQRTEVGECSLVVDIRAGMPAGLKDGNHLRLQCTKDGVTYPLFRGFVQAAPREWPGEVDQISQVEAQDAFSLMSRYELEGQSVASLATGAHLEAVLTAFGWPLAGEIPAGTTWWRLGTTGSSELGTSTILGESLRFLEPGHSTLMATTLTGNLLEHLLNAAETTEGGTFYIGPSGDVIFEESPLPHDPVVATWGPDAAAGELPYRSIVMRRDNSLVYNDIRLTNRGGTEHVVKDATSITDNGPRTLSQSDLLFSTEGQVDSRATDLLTRHKESQEHPVQMVMRPKPEGPLWPYILGTKLGTRIRVKHQYGRPGGEYGGGYEEGYGVGELLTFECLIVGVTFDVGEFWEVTWDLAPAVPILNAWYLGIEGSSNLGTSTKLG